MLEPPHLNPTRTLANPALAGLAHVYGSVALGRRRWFAAHAERRRRLDRPVISVGNLGVGGSGKTPSVGHLATLLREAGERPAILTRGYGRRVVDDGVVVVCDGARIRADLDRAGDEPLMLARSLDGVAVLVGADRYLSGRLAERRLGCTVHLLDDGFQYHPLARDIDLLLVSAADLHHGRVIPAGRLREPVVAAADASAWLVPRGEAAVVAATAKWLGVERTFDVAREHGIPRLVAPYGAPPRVPRDAPAVAVAGIARPDRFFDELAAEGWNLAAVLPYPDHHPFTARDVRRVAAEASRHHATIVLTTEKDLVRWLPLRPLPFALAWVPLAVRIEPAAELARWLLDGIARGGAPRTC